MSYGKGTLIVQTKDEELRVWHKGLPVGLEGGLTNSIVACKFQDCGTIGESEAARCP